MKPDQQNLPVSYEKEVHLLDYLHVLQRRWRIAVIIFLLIFFGVAVKTFLQTPIYQASVILRVGAKPEAASEILERARPGYFSIDSELQILQSYAVAERAARHLAYAGDVMSIVTSGVGVSEMGKETSLIRLSVEKPDPAVARDVANALADAYAEQNRASKAQEATMMLGFIDTQLASMGDDLDRSEQSLQEYRIRTGLERLSPEGASLIDAAVNLEKQRADLSLRHQRIAGFIGALGSGNADFAAVQDVPGVQPEVTRLLELRAKRNDLLRSYTPAHPAVIEVDDALRQVEEKISGSARLAQRSLDQQLGDVGRALGQNTSRLQQVPEEELELVRLSRANKVNSELYGYLLQRQHETRIRQAATSSSVEIIDRAQIPASPVKPNTKKNLALGLVLGAMFGIGVAFLLDYLDRTIKDEDDVQDKLGLPVLGTIPKIGTAQDGSAGRLITCLEPLSPACEAFLALRTNLLYIVTNQKHKTILVTSCLPDEGKSTVAANLAVTLAQTGAKTLLVDCDMRRPSLHRVFDQTEVPGLSDLLIAPECTPLAVRHLRPFGLDFIPDGTEPPNPTQLLNSNQMRAFLASAHERYDYVVLDVPPLLPVADALILASQADLNILVIESCRIPEKLAVRALKSLHSHGATPAGAVLNDKTGKGAKYYGAYSYYEGKYYQGYYRRTEPTPLAPAWRRAVEKVWKFING
jgi:tyrosine-protein kinase Etk/Wzc